MGATIYNQCNPYLRGWRGEYRQLRPQRRAQRPLIFMRIILSEIDVKSTSTHWIPGGATL